MIILLFALFLSLLLSAFFSATETSFISSSEDKLYEIAAKGNKNAHKTLKLLEDKNGIIATALLADNLCNVLASSLITVITIELFGNMDNGAGFEIIIATFFATTMIFLFGEILPKAIALNNAENIAVAITPIFNVFMILLTPFIQFTGFFNRVVFRIIGIKISGKIHIPPHEEIKNVVQMRHEQGRMIKDDKDMLHAVLELSENDVEGIMCHRNEIFAIDICDDIKDIFAQISTSKFSRIPFYDEKPDKIIGFLHIRDFFVALNKVGGDVEKIDLRLILNKPVFVPYKTNLKTQLSEFRRLKTHMVFVVDEYGGVMGLVTFEDLLEEIVGEISDEHDIENNDIIEFADGSILAEGDYPVRDFNKRFDADFDDEIATTMAGLILNIFERIPEENENFKLSGYNINIEKTDSNKIVKLKLTKLTNGN